MTSTTSLSSSDKGSRAAKSLAGSRATPSASASCGGWTLVVSGYSQASSLPRRRNQGWDQRAIEPRQRLHNSHLPQRPPQRASTSCPWRISTISHRLEQPWHSNDRGWYRTVSPCDSLDTLAVHEFFTNTRIGGFTFVYSCVDSWMAVLVPLTRFQKAATAQSVPGVMLGAPKVSRARS
jgi:hypothetical protein